MPFYLLLAESRLLFILSPLLVLSPTLLFISGLVYPAPPDESADCIVVESEFVVEFSEVLLQAANTKAAIAIAMIFFINAWFV